MAVKIGFDTTGNLDELTLVLAYRSGEKIATLSNVKGLMFTESLGNAPEFSFSISKSLASTYWNEIKDFRLIWVAEWDDWYEIYVDVTEDISIEKNISAKHLPEAELSQLNLYSVNINTEEDIAREDYAKTIFYDPNNANTSLLNRVLSKAVNYSVRSDVPKSLQNISKTLVFSFDGTTIHDALLEIAEEVNCLFDFKTYTKDGMIIREVGVYDLESYCNTCGHRSEFHNECPECSSTDIEEGFGDDTPVFWSVDNTCDEITYSTDIDSVKNCFRLEAGDDRMTDAIKNCNPNGSNYIWYFSPEIRETEMSQELKQCLDAYDKKYADFVYEAEYDIQPDAFNQLIEKYTKNTDVYGEEIWVSPDSEVISKPIKGYLPLINAMYNVIDMQVYLESMLMPYVEKIPAATSVSEQMANLKNEIKSIAVNGSVSDTTATNAVLSMARVIIDSRYNVKIENGSVNGNIWIGDYTVTSNSDKTLTLTETDISVEIKTDYESFVQDKIKKALGKSDDTNYSISSLFDLDLADFKIELNKYGRTPLRSLLESCDKVCTVLIDMGVTTDSSKTDLMTKIYDPYYAKSQAISQEIANRDTELRIVADLSERIDLKCAEIQKALDFEKFIQDDNSGKKLWSELSSFRREDIYTNSNYVSDGLSNAEMISYAKEFMTSANKEIIKSATLQHSISTTLKNIFTIEEFKPMLEYFKIGNWIRIGVDEQVYKLRLLSYELDFENSENTSVEFSDVTKIGNDLTDIENVISNAKSMATSYASIERQAYKGVESYNVTDGWTTRGLDATLTKIMNNTDNQTQTWDEQGMLFRKKKDFLDEYEQEQMKIINSTIAITRDNWETISTAIGKIYYEDPQTKEIREAYGVNAEVLIGKLILGENIRIQNSTGSLIFDNNGMTVTQGQTERLKITSDGSITLNANRLALNSSEDIEINNGNFTIKNGNIKMEGTITAGPNSKIGPWIIANDSIYRQSSSFGNSTAGSMYFGTSGLSITNVFQVNSNGKLTCTNADIKGTIKADKGYIGNLTLDGGALYSGTSSMTSTTAGIYLGSTGFRQYSNSNAYVNIKDGIITAKGAKIGGEITATSGTIGGLNISTSTDNISHMYSNSIYTQSSFDYKLTQLNGSEGNSSVDIEFGMKPITDQTHLLLYTRMKLSSQPTWSTDDAYQLFSVNGNGKIKCMELEVTGKKTLKIADGTYSDQYKIVDGEYPPDMKTTIDGIKFNYVLFEDQSVQSDIIPYENSVYNLGLNSFRWKNIYNQNGAITSSDRNLKKDINNLTENHKKFFMKLIPVSFMYTNPNSDRTHVGFIAQDVEKAMEECGLTSLDFAGLCKDIKKEKVSNDKWDKRTVDVYDEDGNPIYIYSLRYTEFIGIITYVLQDTVNRLDKFETIVNQLIAG